MVSLSSWILTLEKKFSGLLETQKTSCVYLLEHPTEKESMFQSVYHTPKSTLNAQVNTSTHNLHAGLNTGIQR